MAKQEPFIKLVRDPLTYLPVFFGVLSIVVMSFNIPLRLDGYFFPPMLFGNCLVLLLFLSWGATVYRNRNLGEPLAKRLLPIMLVNVAIGIWGVSVQIRAAELNPLGLLRAAEWGDARHVDFLLSRRIADPDARDDRGRTALMLAASGGRTQIIASLLRAGADRSLADKDGRTARLLALETFHADAAAALDDGTAPAKETAPPRFETGSFEHASLRRADGPQRLFLQIASETELDQASFWLGLYGPDGPSPVPECGPNTYALHRAGTGLYAVDIDANRCFPLPKDRPLTLRVGYFSIFDRAGRQLRVGREVGRRFVFPKRLEFRLRP